MKYKVGKYVIVPEKPFPTMEKAVQYIQGKYPELDKETIEKRLTPKITDNGKDQSGHIHEEGTTGKEQNSKNSSTGSKGIKPDSHKSR